MEPRVSTSPPAHQLRQAHEEDGDPADVAGEEPASSAPFPIWRMATSVSSSFEQAAAQVIDEVVAEGGQASWEPRVMTSSSRMRPISWPSTGNGPN